MKRLGILTLLCTLLAIPVAYPHVSVLPDRPIYIRLLTNKEIYEPGEAVEIELQAINKMEREVTLNFPDGHQQDYCIDGKYLWSGNKAFIQTPTAVKIPAGGKHSWTFVHTPEDYALAPGTHVIVGTVIGCGRSEPLPIVVRGRQNLEVTVATDDEVYAVGQKIPIDVTITNNGGSEVVLEFRSGRRAGYVIDGEYRRYDGSDLTDVYSTIPLGPGDSYAWHFVHDPADYPLAPGKHTIRGVVVQYGHSEPIGIVVRSGLQISVDTDQDEYELDGDVQIFVTATNNIDEDITLEFNSSHQASYIIDGVYDWRDNHPALMALDTLLIPAHDSKTWEFTHTPDDYRLLPGTHSIVGVVVEYGESEPKKIYVSHGESPIVVSVSTDKETYELGQPVKIDVTATNPSEEPVTLHFSTLHQAGYQIDEAYLWSRDKFFLPIPTSVTLPGGGQITWHFVHTRRDFRLLPGEHSIVGIVFGYGESEPVTITVEEETPYEVTVRGLLVKLEGPIPWEGSLDDNLDHYDEYLLLTRDPERTYYLFRDNIDLEPHVNMTVEVTGVYVYTLLPGIGDPSFAPVPGIPLLVTSIRDLLRVEVQTDDVEYYQQEDIEITVIARNVTEDPQETFTLYIDPFWDVAAWLDNMRIPNVDGIMAPDRPYVRVPIEIPPGDTAEWKIIYSGDRRPLSLGEHSVVSEVVGYGKSGAQLINIIEKPSEKIVADGIVDKLQDGLLRNSDSPLPGPRYVLVDRESGEMLYILRNPMINFGQYLGQYVQVIGVLSEDINYRDVVLGTEQAIPELFVLSIRRLLVVSVSTEKIFYDLGETVKIFLTAKNCTPDTLELTFSSPPQAYYRISAPSGGDSYTGQQGDGSTVEIPPHGLHLWKFDYNWEELASEPGSYTVVGGVYGYAESKPIVITVKPNPPEIARATGIIEKFWWWKWFDPVLETESVPEPWPWIYPCRYVLFDPGEQKVLYFLSSHRVELEWYVGSCVEITGYPAERFVIDDVTLGSSSGGERRGDPDRFFPPILPPDIWPDFGKHLNVVSVLPSDECPPLDGDGNGLRDAWEIVTGLRQLGADKSEDSDGDGMPNIVEYFCGTDPLDPTSVVNVKTEVNAAGMVVLRWATVLGKTYSVYCADGPHAGPLQWRPLVRGLEGMGGELEWTDDGAPDVPPSNASGIKCRFYRVMVE